MTNKQNNTALPASILTYNQKKTVRKDYFENDKPKTLIIELRYDDECKNGHNSFAITGELYETYHQPGKKTLFHSCGCLHEDIAKHAPEFAKYIKWHLTSSDGPMHYLANTLYYASNADYNGKTAGEADSFEEKLYFGNFPISFKIKNAFLEYLKSLSSFENITIKKIEHKDKNGHEYAPNYTFTNYTNEWHECPFDTEKEAKEFLAALKEYPYRIEKIATSFSKGKERDFDAARNSAVWPEASNETLSLPKEALEKLLIDRLQTLMAEFKTAMEEIGFTY